MAKDFRRGANRPVPRRNRQKSCVWWFLLGTMLGSFGVGLYWMLEAPPGQVPPPVAAIPKVERPAPQRPSFQFPDILKDTEVEIGKEQPLPPPAPRPEPPQRVEQTPGEETTTQEPAASGSYMLQVASFKRASDAERMKAQLALRGISSRVQAATIKNGQVWHRVITGPYPNKQSMTSAQAELKRHGNDSMPIKVK